MAYRNTKKEGRLIYIDLCRVVMSQGDYIKFKKTGVQLRAFTAIDPSGNRLPSYSQYDAFVGYNIETTTPNSSVNFGKQTVPANVIQVFGMKIGNASSGCPTFPCIKSPPEVIVDTSGGGGGGDGNIFGGGGDY